MWLETSIAGALIGAFGNSFVLILFAVMFFVSIIAITKIGFEAGVVIMIPVLMLCFSIFDNGAMKLLSGLGIAFLLFFMIMRLIHR